MDKPAILIGVGEQMLRRNLKALLFRRLFNVVECSDKAGICSAFQNTRPALVIVGGLGVSRDALEVAQQIRRLDQKVFLVLIVSDSSEELAIAALKAGISDYLKQPISLEEIDSSVRRLIPDSFGRETGGPSRTQCQEMIGDSPAMQAIKAYLLKVASTDTNVFITGETGTGKELVAELIHRNSPRGRGPFACINCAAVPENLVESELFGYEKGAFTGANSLYEGRLKSAMGGTVFLDEIGDMSLYAQAKILRVIESKEIHRLGAKRSIPVDVRIIAATNRDLGLFLSEGKFRHDLYFRLNVARIHLPPLRDRKEDIVSLSRHYIREYNSRFERQVEGFTEDATQALLRYNWPGNIREFKNILEASFINVSSRKISFLDFPEEFRRQWREDREPVHAERERLIAALSTSNWNKSAAALKLRWSRMTLYRKMAKYRIRDMKVNETQRRSFAERRDGRPQDKTFELG